MSTKAYYKKSEIGPGKVGFSKTRSIIEAAFYGNNVVKVNTLKEAYNLAKNSPGTIVTDMPVYRGEEFGLDADAKVLLFNDGAITGRYATARRIAGEPGVDCEALDKVVMDAVYSARYKKLYHATCFAGLDEGIAPLGCSIVHPTRKSEQSTVVGFRLQGGSQTAAVSMTLHYDYRIRHSCDNPVALDKIRGKRFYA